MIKLDHKDIRMEIIPHKFVGVLKRGEPHSQVIQWKDLNNPNVVLKMYELVRLMLDVGNAMRMVHSEEHSFDALQGRYRASQDFRRMISLLEELVDILYHAERDHLRDISKHSKGGISAGPDRGGIMSDKN